MFNTLARRILFVAVIVLSAYSLVSLAEMDKGKRLAIIKGLLLKGVVGENKDGFLEFRGAKQAEEVVNEENQVRKKEYIEVAKKVGSSPQEAGQVRAKQNANNAPGGAWIQDNSGTWKQK